MLCRNFPPQKTVVKLGHYQYGKHLKELANYSLEDSEHLSPGARQQLSSVRWEKKCFVVVFLMETQCSLCCLFRGLLKCNLQMKTYCSRFHLLLHLEEIQMEVDIRKYDLLNQTMTVDPSNKKLLILNVSWEDDHRTCYQVIHCCLGFNCFMWVCEWINSDPGLHEFPSKINKVFLCYVQCYPLKSALMFVSRFQAWQRIVRRCYATIA